MKFRIKNWSFPYALGYVIVNAGINTFYKRHQVIGLENIPKDKPVIFASNHQNAFLDPVIIAVNLSKPTYYLVRADIFKKPLVAAIFESINMLPIFRERDGVNTKEANNGTFDRCYDILEKKRPIIIFPEGNHGKYKNLRGVKKGIARIAGGAEDKHGKNIDVQIVPIGVNYSEHSNMGAELFLNIGKPMDVSEYLKTSGDPKEINQLKNDLEPRMSELIIDIDLKNYDVVHESMMIFEQEIINDFGTGNNILEDKFNAQKKFISILEKELVSGGVEITNEESENFKIEVEKQGLRYWLFKKEKHNTIFSILGLLLLLPLHIYGVINNYLPYKIPVWFVNKKIKDKQFHGSLKMALGVFLFAIFWLLQGFIIGSLLPAEYYWAYWISLPLSGWLSYQYWIKYLRTKGQLKYNALSRAGDKKFLHLKKEYTRFKELYDKINGSH